MRLFIAIRPGEEMLAALTGLQDALMRRGLRGSFTPAENLHLTLAFIGEWPDPDAVLDAMEAAAFSPFSLRLEGIGQFGGLWWAGLGGSEELNALARRLRRALAEAGIPFDRKKFTPHITLVRRAVWDAKNGIPTARVPNAGTAVTRLSLMRSDRGKSGMIYTEIGSVGGE